jgi:hypothetical protein
MEKQLLHSEDPDKREQILRDSCDKIEQLSYVKKFTIDEMAQKKSELSSTMIQLSNYEAKLAEVKAEFTEKMKPLKVNVQQTVAHLRDKARLVQEQCYVMYDYDQGIAGYYNRDGDLVHSRPLEVGERQTKLFKLTGTDND